MFKLFLSFSLDQTYIRKYKILERIFLNPWHKNISAVCVMSMKWMMLWCFHFHKVTVVAIEKEVEKV